MQFLYAYFILVRYIPGILWIKHFSALKQGCRLAKPSMMLTVWKKIIVHVCKYVYVCILYMYIYVHICHEIIVVELEKESQRVHESHDRELRRARQERKKQQKLDRLTRQIYELSEGGFACQLFETIHITTCHTAVKSADR